MTSTNINLGLGENSRNLRNDLLDDIAGNINATIFSGMSQAEIEANVSSTSGSESEMCSQYCHSDEDAGFISSHRRKVFGRQKRKKKVDWYGDECKNELRSTNELFKSLAELNQQNKLEVLNEFSKFRHNLAFKYKSILAMNASKSTISTISTSSATTTTATSTSINTYSSTPTIETFSSTAVPTINTSNAHAHTINASIQNN